MNKKTFAAILLTTMLVGIGSVAYSFNGELKNETLGIQNSEGKNIGSLKDALVDSSGEVAYVVVSLSKESGQEGKDIAVPLNAFSYDHTRKMLVLNMTTEQLALAPEFHLSDLADPRYAERLNRFYGEAPAWPRPDPGTRSKSM
jgi:hypothetical protein